MRPSLHGMTTGLIHASGQSEPADFEIELDPAHSLVYVRTATGVVKGVPLRGQPAVENAFKAVEAAVSKPFDEGIAIERQLFAEYRKRLPDTIPGNAPADRIQPFE